MQGDYGMAASGRRDIGGFLDGDGDDLAARALV